MNYSTYARNISFVTGVVDYHGTGYSLPKADRLEDCCGICFQGTPAGCNLWVWNPRDNPLVPCTIVMGYFGADHDKQCPYGHTNSSAFAIQAKGNGTGWSGPCGDWGFLVDVLPPE